MRYRLIAPVTALAALIVTSLIAAPMLGQTRTAPTGAAAAAKKWTAPRTPWGDPDLQGSYSNTSENGTPLERPEIFEGRKLEDIKGEELLALKRDAQKRTIENFGGPLHAPEGWWQPDLNMVKGSQAWLVVDPPNGKVPPMTPEATAAHCGPRRGAPRQRARAGRLVGRPQPLRPVHHARHTGLDDAGHLRQRLPDCAGAGLRRHHLRDDPRDSRHSARRRPHAGSAIRSYVATRAAIGKATRWLSRRRISERKASTATRIPQHSI